MTSFLQKFFGISRPSQLSIDVDAAVKKWQLEHHRNTECLVCSALVRGADPLRLELVQEQRGFELVTSVRERPE